MVGTVPGSDADASSLRFAMKQRSEVGAAAGGIEVPLGALGHIRTWRFADGLLPEIPGRIQIASVKGVVALTIVELGLFVAGLERRRIAGRGRIDGAGTGSVCGEPP